MSTGRDRLDHVFRFLEGRFLLGQLALLSGHVTDDQLRATLDRQRSDPQKRPLGTLLLDGGLLTSAHDLSDGGLAQALVESCLRNGVGVRVELTGDPFVELFAESAGRALISVQPDATTDFLALCDEHGVPATVLGSTEGTGEDAQLSVEGQFAVPLGDLRTAWTGTLPAAFWTTKRASAIRSSRLRNCISLD